MTLKRILRYDIKAKFYHPTTVQPLTAFHIQQRLEFNNWFLAQEEGFEQRVMWTDEKFFVLRQRPNRKNDGIWSRSNPHEIIETNDRNRTKVILFVAIVGGKIPIVDAFIDHTGRTLSVNGSCYLALLKEVVWPVFRTTATRKRIRWMQGGAPPHCTNDVKNFLLENFQGCVISRGTNVIWPAHLPDLNPLDFISGPQPKVRYTIKKTDTIDSLVNHIKKEPKRSGIKRFEAGKTLPRRPLVVLCSYNEV